jgi:transposase
MAEMIGPEQVFLLQESVDMRWGIDRLSVLIQQIDGRSPCDGTAYGFTNRSHSRIKLLIWDGTGVWLCHRRLHKGRFRWPVPGETLYRMSAEQWRWLTTGIEWQRLCATPHTQWRV